MPERIILPYEFIDDALELRVSSVMLDGKAVDVAQVVDLEHNYVSLSEREGWSKATLQVNVADTNGQVAGALLPDEDLGAVDVYLVVSDIEGRSRGGLKLRAEVTQQWVGALELARRDVRGPVRLEPIAVRGRDGEADGHHAARRGERVAGGPGWSVYLEDRPVMPGAAIDSEWCDFANDTRDLLRHRADLVWFLDTSNSDRPKLLLNEGVAGLKRALQATQRTGRTARVRDALAHSISQPVLLALAVEALESAGDAGLDDLGGWQRKLLLALAQQSGERTEEDTVEGWLRSWEEGDRTPAMIDLVTGIQLHLGARPAAEYLIEALEERDNG